MTVTSRRLPQHMAATTKKKTPRRQSPPPASPRVLPAKRRKSDDASTSHRKLTFIEDARRRQILDAALKLFAERGYDRTSLSDLAARINVSKGVVSYHFQGKAELGREALRHLLRRYRDFVRTRLDAKPTARLRLLELPLACIDFVQGDPMQYLVYLDTLGSFGTARERQEFMARALAGMRRLITDLISAAQTEGSVAKFPPGPLADLIQASVDGLTEQAALDPSAVDLEASKALLGRMLAMVLDRH